MSQRIQLGETGDSLVNKFNYNAQQLDNLNNQLNNLNNQIQQHQEQINEIPKKSIVVREIRDFDGNNNIVDSYYTHNCLLDTIPLDWNFYIIDEHNRKKRIEVDSIYYLYDNSIFISFVWDIDDTSMLCLEVISYE